MLFRRLLYLFLIYKSLSWLCYYDLLFGANSIIVINSGPPEGLRKFAFILYGSPGVSQAFIFLTLGISIFLLIRLKAIPMWISMMFNFSLWFLVLNLHNVIYSTLTGGNYLLNQFLFFNCFLSVSENAKEKSGETIKVCAHNLAVTAIMIQVSLTYFLSALAKLNDSGWLSGYALDGIFRVDHYFVFRSAIEQLPIWLSIFLNYLVLAYQFLFPFSVFFSRFKKSFLLAGIFMHLYISFVMGLTDFGIIMILGYVYFWPFKQSVQ